MPMLVSLNNICFNKEAKNVKLVEKKINSSLALLSRTDNIPDSCVGVFLPSSSVCKINRKKMQT